MAIDRYNWNMNEATTKKDELRPEYDLNTLLDGGVRGKYAAQYQEGTNLALRIARIFSPRLAHPEQAIDFEMQIIDESPDTSA